MHKSNWFGYLGVTAAVVTILSWIMFIMTEPFGNDDAKWVGYLVITVMLGCSFLAAWSSIKKKIFWLTIAFLVSFFPVGLYMLFTPSVSKWIGIGNLVYMVSAIGMYLQIRKKGGDDISTSSKD